MMNRMMLMKGVVRINKSGNNVALICWVTVPILSVEYKGDVSENSVGVVLGGGVVVCCLLVVSLFPRVTEKKCLVC